jgi:UDP-4-keto-6-deoxy-N-acetylglucosamine 4-aminotransferase
MDKQQTEQTMRETNLPYGRQLIDDDDVAATVAALRSDWLTGGPKVGAFEQAVAGWCGAAHGVAVCNGTAALHCAMQALDVGPGDEVIVPPLTFCATANAVLYQGGVPVFADVSPDTLLIDPQAVADCITPRTKGIIAVDYAGQPCDYDALRALASRHGLFLVADACHSLGGRWRERPVGTLADVTCLSFHPVKHITTGEGGMALTDDARLAERMRLMRSHGVDADPSRRAQLGTWRYDVVSLGHNYRITDIQCALGISQLNKLPQWLEHRSRLAVRYAAALKAVPGVAPLAQAPGATHAWHLYVVRVDKQQTPGRDVAFQRLRERKIMTNVHYTPVYMHSYFQRYMQNGRPRCPHCEAAFEEILSLPMHAAMTAADVTSVVDALKESLLA